MPRLYIITGQDKGKSFDLPRDLIFIGRSPDNDIQINDITVSRRHLRLNRNKERYFVTDLGSKNGTFLKGRRIPAGQAFEIEEGSSLAVGKVVLSMGRPYNKEMKRWRVMGLRGDALSIQDSVDLPHPHSGQRGGFQENRPMTSQKNMEFIHKVSTVLMRSSDIKKTLEEILDSIFELFKRIDRGLFILIDDESKEVLGVISKRDKEEPEKIRPYSRTIVNRVVQEERAVVMLDTSEEDKANLSESMELMNIRSVMCVPLISRSTVRGVIYVDSLDRPHGFRKDDLSLLTALSSPAAMAIENAVLYGDLERIMAQRPH